MPKNTTATYSGAAGITVYNQPAADQTALYVVGDFNMTANFTDSYGTVDASITNLVGGIVQDIPDDGQFPGPFGDDVTSDPGSVALSGEIDGVRTGGTIDGSFTHNGTTYNIAGEYFGTFRGENGSKIRIAEDTSGEDIKAVANGTSYEAGLVAAGTKD